MSVSVRIGEALYSDAKAHAQAECRTVAGQIEFWAKLGKAALDNPDLPVDFVCELMLARAEGRGQATPFTPEALRD
ncbi:MAG: ParD-like family protein [Methylococcaceae bacterium]|nr:ParD-like family protein [Methylococcaceae bacterium]